MEKMYEYFTFGQIQRLKQEWFETHKTGLSFKEAAEKLVETGQTSYGIPQKPDFLSWNLMDMRDLQNRICHIPISLDEIQDVQNQVMDQVNYLSILNEVQITMESCYTKPELVSVNYFTIIYVLNGSCILAAENGSQGSKRRHPPQAGLSFKSCHSLRSGLLMKKGELCILPPGVPYYVRTTPNDIVLNISSNRVNFEKQFNKLLYQNNIISDFLRNALFKDAKDCIFFMIQPTKDFKSIIQHLFSEFVQKDSYSESLFYYYLQIFYINIIRSTQHTCQYYAREKGATAKMLAPTILQYINEHYRSLTLDELAEQFHYESAYLSRFIKASTGKNYTQIIAELKIQEARKLLTQTNLGIAEIALQAGYHSADHFTYSFKQACGLSPTKFRKSSHISENGR